MKLLLWFVLAFTFLITLSLPSKAQAPFVTTWKTDNTGVSANNQIIIPTEGTGYNYEVNWVSTTDPSLSGTLTGQTGDVTITFPSAGTYKVSISSNFPQIYFNNGGDKSKILSVEQWGEIEWRSMENAFFGAEHLLVNASDAPNLSEATSMFRMFEGASSLNSDLNHWDVSNIENMGALFKNASAFNGSINNWDVANVWNMGSMFQSASAFNGNLGSWDVSSVNNMSIMFGGATAFTGTGLDNWDVSNVLYMGSMFGGATVFNSSIGGWDVSKVTDMSSMFIEASAFNTDLNGWDVSSVTNMNYMFMLATSFNGDISNWDVSSVITMNSMFQNAASFDGDLTGWDVSKVTSMSTMFSHASAFSGRGLETWTVGQVADMSSMFNSASAFNADISGWDVSKVTSMANMFYQANTFDRNLGDWDISHVGDMSSMLHFSGLSRTNYDSTLSGWASQTVQSGVTLGALNLEYCATSERQSLIDNYGWIFVGDTPSLVCPYRARSSRPGKQTIRVSPATMKSSSPLQALVIITIYAGLLLSTPLYLAL